MANEIRLRRSNIAGTITDNPLTNVATTINSPGFADLPVVDGTNHLILILDPLELGGPAEIVRVTAHTSLATSVTVLRGQEGSSARSHIFQTTWFHGPVASDWTLSDVTSSTRPSPAYEGQFIYETDTNKLVGFGGTDWAPRDAGGQLGYAQAVVSQTGITTITDLTNITTTVTVGTGRRVKLTFQGGFQRTVNDGIGRYYIREGGTTLMFADALVRAAGEGQIGAHMAYVTTPTAGAHTYKVSLERVTGTGSVSNSCDANSPSFILVEDIGAA